MVKAVGINTSDEEKQDSCPSQAGSVVLSHAKRNLHTPCPLNYAFSSARPSLTLTLSLLLKFCSCFVKVCELEIC